MKLKDCLTEASYIVVRGYIILQVHYLLVWDWKCFFLVSELLPDLVATVLQISFITVATLL